MYELEGFTGRDTKVFFSFFFLPIQQTLHEKLVELQKLTVQEKRLRQGERVGPAVKPLHFLSQTCSEDMQLLMGTVNCTLHLNLIRSSPEERC